MSLSCYPVTDHVNSAVFPVSRWETLCKTIWVVAWVSRFFRNARSSPFECMKGGLFLAELEKNQCGPDAADTTWWLSSHMHLCKLVDLSRRVPLTSSSFLWWGSYDSWWSFFCSLICPMIPFPSIHSWFPNLIWQFSWCDSSINCSSMVTWSWCWFFWRFNIT